MKCLDLHSKKKLALAVRLPSYKPGNVIIRFVIISIIAVGVLNLITFIVGTSEHTTKPASFYYITIIIAFNLVAEFQIILDTILERFLPVPKKLKLRLAIQLVLGLLVLLLVMKGLMFFIEPELLEEHSRPGIFMGLLMGLLFVQMTASSLAVARFTQKWLDSQEQIAEMKREKLRMDYNSLQDQLNPHFLFNNLSVLKSLIIYDQSTALEFTENFTDVYRYVLQSKDKRLVKLSEEFEFIESYIGLHKERLGAGIEVKSAILEQDLEKEIAPLTLQLLVENAIKHNVTSKESPLKIEITTDAKFLIVSNSLNLRASSYSTKTGLRNLVKRYEMLTSEEIVVQYDEERFEVKIPML
ncbi:histidine kinase [uncultured Draconibacterium sp.]|uniref:sensor histidine kinase n=1 Tax=uncultured Draconibacterium sp. TaxID=1573823 RepID=UPI00321646E8